MQTKAAKGGKRGGARAAKAAPPGRIHGARPASGLAEGRKSWQRLRRRGTKKGACKTSRQKKSKESKTRSAQAFEKQESLEKQK
jgi:hypothetical protein